jgi:aminobenzoyl-glutamate utilization protein B
MPKLFARLASLALVLSLTAPVLPQSRAKDYKTQVLKDVEAMTKQTQVMVDMVFSFGELGFQEYETSKYLTGILEKEGFKIERGISGIPTAWIARGAQASRSWHSAPILIAFRRPRKSRVSHITIR